MGIMGLAGIGGPGAGGIYTAALDLYLDPN